MNHTKTSHANNHSENKVKRLISPYGHTSKKNGVHTEDTRFPFSVSTLNDGLRVVHVPMQNAASVNIQVYFGAGSRYEDNDIAGISHFLEHMAFKATKKRPTAKEVSLAIEGIGGILNAWTSEEATAYWCHLPAVHFEEGFEVLSDMLLHSTLPAKEITREAQVILEEMAREEDNPDQRVFDVFTSLIYPNQALGRRVIGSEQTVLAVTRGKLLEYIDSLYAPQNAVVSIAGPLSQKEVERVVTKYMQLPKRSLKRSWQPLQQKKTGLPISLYHKDTEQVHMMLGLTTFPREDGRTAAQSVLNTVLGHGMSSRLFVNVRERKGLAYSIGSANEYFHDTGIWFCYGGIKREKIDTAITAVLEELAAMANKPIPEKELKEAKEKVRGRFILGLETTNALAGYYGKQVLLEKEVETPENWLAKIDKVSAGDMQVLAKSLFKTENLRLAMIGPYKEKDRFKQLLKM